MQLLESEHDEIVAGPSDRNFGFTMAAVFALIGGFGLYKGSSHAPLWLCIAAIFAGLTLWRPQSLNLANRAWLKLGLLMYRVVNPVIMAILFFGAIVPQFLDTHGPLLTQYIIMFAVTFIGESFILTGYGALAAAGGQMSGLSHAVWRERIGGLVLLALAVLVLLALAAAVLPNHAGR